MDDQDPNNQVITIDSEISRILGLEDNFDLDPDEYLQLVRAKLVEYDILAGSKNITPEQQEEQRILASQVREIRAQKRTGNIKYNTGKVGKRINKDAFFNKKPEETKEPEKRIVDPSKLLPGTVKTGEIIKSKTQRVEDLKREKPEEENKGLFTIQKILNSILDNLKNQFKFDQKKTEEQRREKETKKREKKESGLEKGFAMVKSAVKKMLAPFQNILDQIFKYFFFTFLGKMFTDLMNWLSDPKNKKKVEVLGRFLKDWWPLLLGAYLMFASPLGLFIKGALKMIGGLTSQILKLLPRLLNLSKSLVTSRPARAAGSALLNVVRSPFVWFPAAVAGTAALANEITGQRKAAPVQAQNKARAQAGEGLGVQGVGGVGDMGPTTPYGMLQGIKRGGIVRGYSDGAMVEDGYSGINSDTGVSITGAGRDTQLIAARPGEVVLTPEDAGVIQERTGFDVYNFVKNRKPSYTNFNNIKMSGGIPLANTGGILGFNNGGIVGGVMDFFSKPKGLSVKGVEAGFTGMAREGFEAIMGGDKFRLGSWKPQILGRGAYSAPTLKGAQRYAGSSGSLGGKQTPGGVVKSIVPGNAPRINIIEPQARVSPTTFDKGKVLADKLLSGKYSNSPLANKLRSQLVSGMVQRTGMGLGRLLSRGAGLLNAPVISDMLFPEGTTAYDQLTGPNAYYNAPGYRGPKPSKKQGGGLLNAPGYRGPKPSKKQGGGLIKESTGYNIPGATSDRQYLPPMAVQPGEAHYIIPKDAVDRGAVPMIDRLVAATDSNSTPAKLGFRNKSINIKPPQNRLNNSMMLPPIKTSASGGMKGSSTANAQDFVSFSPVLETSFDVRKMYVDIYGILD